MQIKRLIEFSTLNYYISISLRQQDTFAITVLFLFLVFCLFRRQYSLDKNNNYQHKLWIQWPHNIVSTNTDFRRLKYSFVYF